MDQIEPEILQNYQIQKRLGKGAYGIVWKAKDKTSEEVVAVKKIFDAFRNSIDAQRTFREIAFLKEFSEHENIIKLHRVMKSTNKKDIYLIFEYSTADLDLVIRKNNILKDIHKQSIMYQILKAMIYIHSANVIHRDMKPSNILINESCQIKICDFGMARSIHNIDKVQDMAMTDYIATRWYRSPEILLANTQYSTKVDMWSVGCIFAEMYRGIPLFAGNSTIQQIDMIVDVSPPKSKHDIVQITSNYARSILEKLMKRHGHKKLENMLVQETPLEAIDLIANLLVFNPSKRYSAEEAIEHDFLQQFYNPNALKKLDYHLIPPVDDCTKLTVKEYREMLFFDTENDSIKCYRKPYKVDEDSLRESKSTEKDQNGTNKHSKRSEMDELTAKTESLEIASTSNKKSGRDGPAPTVKFQKAVSRLFNVFRFKNLATASSTKRNSHTVGNNSTVKTRSYTMPNISTIPVALNTITNTTSSDSNDTSAVATKKLSPNPTTKTDMSTVDNKDNSHDPVSKNGPSTVEKTDNSPNRTTKTDMSTEKNKSPNPTSNNGLSKEITPTQTKSNESS